MVGVLLLALAASPELPFEPPGARVVAPGPTWDITSASAPAFLKTLVVWVSQGRMGIEKPGIYGARVQPSGNVDDPEGLLLSQPFGRDPSVAWVPSMNAWVVAWEMDGETFLRVVRFDGSFDPATLTPVSLGQGRAPTVAAAANGYYVMAEAVQAKVWFLQPPATPVASTTALGANPLRYGSPVRGAVTDPSNPASPLGVSWVFGTTLAEAKVVAAAPMISVATLPPLLVSPVRVDLEAMLFTNTQQRVASLVSDGGSTTVLVQQFEQSGVPPLVLDAGAVLIDNLAMAELNDSSLALTATQVDGQGVAWRLFADGGFTGLGTLTNGVSRLSVASFAPVTSQGLLLSSTYTSGVLAQPATGLTSSGPPIQLNWSRAGHRFAQVASWSGGTMALWQRQTNVEAEYVTWRVFPDGGHASGPDLVGNSSRLDVPSLTSVPGGVALLSRQQLRRLDSTGIWSGPITVPRSLSSGTLTTDGTGRLVVVGMQQLASDEEAWALRQEASGSFTERLLFPTNSLKPQRPKLAMSRDGGFGLAIINPAEEVWATRLTSDLVAQDDAGFRISGPASIDPFVVSDESGGFLVVYTDYSNVLVRRVVGTTTSPETMLLRGEWDVGSVIEVPGGAAVNVSSRATSEVATLFLTVDGGVVSASSQTVVSGGSFTNGVGLAVGQDTLTWVFGRYDADAGAATTRSVVASRAVGAPCMWGWQCLSGLCANIGVCRPAIVPVDAGFDAGVVVDAGVPDAGVADAGVVDAGVVDAGVVDAGVVDAGVVDAGLVDAGVVDAGVVDAGVVDAGVVDAGVVDAGVVDAGEVDAGEVDAGATPSDAGTALDGGARIDAGAFVDAGSEPRAVNYRAGCDCQSGAGPWLISALVFLASARRRRR